MLVFVLGYIACFALSVGPVTWVILTEIFPTRIRGRAMAIATVALWIGQLRRLPDVPHDGRKPLARRHVPPRLSLLGLRRVLRRAALVFVRAVPETKGKTLEQIERAIGCGSGAGPGTGWTAWTNAGSRGRLFRCEKIPQSLYGFRASPPKTAGNIKKPLRGGGRGKAR